MRLTYLRIFFPSVTPSDYIPAKGGYDTVDLEGQNRDSIGLEWINVSYSVVQKKSAKKKEEEKTTIIHPMSGTANPGEMLALMVCIQHICKLTCI